MIFMMYPFQNLEYWVKNIDTPYEYETFEDILEKSELTAEQHSELLIELQKHIGVLEQRKVKANQISKVEVYAMNQMFQPNKSESVDKSASDYLTNNKDWVQQAADAQGISLYDQISTNHVELKVFIRLFRYGRISRAYTLTPSEIALVQQSPSARRARREMQVEMNENKSLELRIAENAEKLDEVIELLELLKHPLISSTNISTITPEQKEKLQKITNTIESTRIAEANKKIEALTTEKAKTEAELRAQIENLKSGAETNARETIQQNDYWKNKLTLKEREYYRDYLKNLGEGFMRMVYERQFKAFLKNVREAYPINIELSDILDLVDFGNLLTHMRRNEKGLKEYFQAAYNTLLTDHPPALATVESIAADEAKLNEGLEIAEQEKAETAEKILILGNLLAIYFDAKDAGNTAFAAEFLKSALWIYNIKTDEEAVEANKSPEDWIHSHYSAG